MSKSKFYRLIELLRIDVIIFIDNDFDSEDNAGIILYKATFLSPGELNGFITRISELGNQKEATLIKGFISKLAELSFDQYEVDLLEIGEIKEALTSRFAQNFEENEIERTLEGIEILLRQQPTIFREILLSHGLVRNTSGIGNYQFLINEVNQFQPRKVVKFYKGMPGKKLVEFSSELQRIFNDGQQGPILMIIDKYLEGNEKGNEITDFLLRGGGDGTQFENFISVMYTSQEAEVLTPERKENHYLFQIRKPDGGNQVQVLDTLSQALAFCAYGIFFNKFINVKETALESLKSSIHTPESISNLLYIAGKAHSIEGANVFSVLDSWLELYIKKKVNDSLTNEEKPFLQYQYISGLTQLISSDFFTSQSFKTSGVHNNFIPLNQFEIFDLNVNKFHYPPSVGDIYMIKDRIYVLAGQDCDLIVRHNDGDIKRRERIAELVECEMDNSVMDEKLKETKDSIEYNYFPYDSKIYSLKIKLGKRAMFDFRILDLCIVDTDGNSVISKRNLSSEHLSVMPNKLWQQYFPKMVEQLQEKIKIQELITKSSLDKNNLMSEGLLFIDYKSNDQGIEFPVKRICKLRGPFKDIFVRRLLDYKARIALNTIPISRYESVLITKIKVGFPLSSSAYEEIDTSISGVRELSTDFANVDKPDNRGIQVVRNTISDLLQNSPKELFSKVSFEEIKISNNGFIDPKTNIKIEKKYNKQDDTYELTLNFPSYNEKTGTNLIAKHGYDIEDIFGKELSDSLFAKQSAQIKVGAKMRNLRNGDTFEKISLLDLKSGFEITELNLKVSINTATGNINFIKINE